MRRGGNSKFIFLTELFFVLFIIFLVGHVTAQETGDISLTVEGDDTTAPTVNIVDPETTTYTSNRTSINYTVSDAGTLNICWYSLDSGVTNVTITCGNNVTGISSQEGANTWTVYANDTSGNEGNDLVTFSIDTSGGGGGGGGGGGSGGSGTTKIIEKDFGNFEVVPSELNFNIALGKMDVKEVRVVNTGNKKLIIDMRVSGINKFVGLNTNRVEIEPGETAVVVVSITSSETGVHAGRVIFSTEGVQRDLLILINVRSGESLFDVSLTVPESYKFIFLNEDIRTFISLIQIGEKIGEDVTANYIIKDFDGNTLYTDSETFFVLGSKSFVKTFMTSDLPTGDYIAGIEISYPGGLATSSAHFTIREHEPKYKLKDILVWISISTLVILVFIVIVFEILRYKKAGRRLNRRHKRK